LLVGVFANNYVLQQTTGICPFLGVSKKIDQAAGMGAAVIFVMLCATAVTWPIQKLVLEAFGLEYLQTIVFILVIAALVQFVEIILKKFIPALYKSLGVYLPLITTNCAVLGIAIDNFSYDYVTNFGTAIVSSLGVGLGFLFAMVLFAGVRSKVDNCDAPKAIKGLPATLIAASIVSLAFYGFAGVIDGLLGM
jgi:electron transport complex protein RnfA